MNNEALAWELTSRGYYVGYDCDEDGSNVEYDEVLLIEVARSEGFKWDNEQELWSN